MLSALVIVSCLAGAEFFMLINAESQTAATNSNLANLQKNYEDLLAKYYALLGNFSTLNYDYQSVLLQSPFQAISAAGNSAAPDTQEMLTRYQALQQLYVNLQEQYNDFVENYGKLKVMTDLRTMQGELGQFVTPNNPEVVSLVANITGKVGNSTDPNRYWKDIKAMYDWVTVNVQYREDSLYPLLPGDPATAVAAGLQQTNSVSQYPNETIKFRGGDCDDIAALLTSMIRSYFNGNYLAECIWITGANEGHVATVIPFSGDQIVILDPIRNYYTHDTLGNIWYGTISQEIYNWMNIWRPSLGNDVHVYCVYSDYMLKYFNGTEAYVNWMYSRGI